MARSSLVLVATSLVCIATGTPADAQDVMSKESVATLKSSFSADLDTLHQKFLGLAQAFPQDRYTWRPMEGVRSVSEVLMLAAFEGYAFIPSSLARRTPTSERAKKRTSCAPVGQGAGHRPFE